MEFLAQISPSPNCFSTTSQRHVTKFFCAIDMMYPHCAKNLGLKNQSLDGGKICPMQKLAIFGIFRPFGFFMPNVDPNKTIGPW